MKLFTKVKNILVNFKKAVITNSKAVVRTIFASLVTLVALVGGILLMIFVSFPGVMIVGIVIIILSLFNLIGIKNGYSDTLLKVEGETAQKAKKGKVKAFVKADKKKTDSRDATMRYRNRQDKNKLDLD